MIPCGSNKRTPSRIAGRAVRFSPSFDALAAGIGDILRLDHFPASSFTFRCIYFQVMEMMLSLAKPGGLHQSTVLFIMGDHGQTMSGDHGGGSVEEVETALFAINLAAAAAELGDRELRSVISSVKTVVPGEVDGKGASPSRQIDAVEQIDFSATISALLGLPIPFENVGVRSSRMKLVIECMLYGVKL